MLEMRQAGAYTIAQDEETSMIWGMPGAAVRMEAAVAVLPLDGIAPALCQWAQRMAGGTRK
jgi:chemotaxis response regulator CheB